MTRAVAINSAPNADVSFNVFGGNVTAGVYVTGDRGLSEGALIHDNTMNADAIVGCGLLGVACADNAA